MVPTSAPGIVDLGDCDLDGDPLVATSLASSPFDFERSALLHIGISNVPNPHPCIGRGKTEADAVSKWNDSITGSTSFLCGFDATPRHVESLYGFHWVSMPYESMFTVTHGDGCT